MKINDSIIRKIEDKKAILSDPYGDMLGEIKKIVDTLIDEADPYDSIGFAILTCGWVVETGFERGYMISLPRTADVCEYLGEFDSLADVPPVINFSSEYPDLEARAYRDLPWYEDVLIDFDDESYPAIAQEFLEDALGHQYPYYFEAETAQG